MRTITVYQSSHFSRWFSGLRDLQAQARILTRIGRMEQGNLGDAKPVGKGIHEARIDYGAGYRLYFIHQGSHVVVLLAGGDKRTQKKDIASAYAIAQQWKEPS